MAAVLCVAQVDDKSKLPKLCAINAKIVGSIKQMLGQVQTQIKNFCDKFKETLKQLDGDADEAQKAKELIGNFTTLETQMKELKATEDSLRTLIFALENLEQTFLETVENSHSECTKRAEKFMEFYSQARTCQGSFGLTGWLTSAPRDGRCSRPAPVVAPTRQRIHARSTRTPIRSNHPTIGRCPAGHFQGSRDQD